MRKILACLLMLTVLLCSAVPAAATEQEDLHRKIVESYDSGMPVNLHQWVLSLEKLEQIHDRLYYSGQLPWYAGSGFSYSYIDNLVTTFQPQILDKQIYDRQLYEQKMAELMAEACLPGMTDWQLALSVHDYIILHAAYDETYEKETGYDALVGGTSVCSGYATLYMDVMNRLGIPCQLVICEDTGDGNGHGWNLIQLDGQWYHVDLTWDDPIPDTYGYVSHDHFLKTSEEFRTGETPHDFDWIALEQTPEEPYILDEFPDDSASAFCFVDACTAVYRMEREGIHQIWRMDLNTGEENLLYEFERMGIDLGDGTYLYPTRGLNFWNGRIYFNREDRVLSMLPDGSDVQEVYYREPDDRYILGSFADDGMLYLTLLAGDHSKTSEEVMLEDVTYHLHSFDTVTVEPTCEDGGFSRQMCSCGITCNYTELSALGHEIQIEVIKEPNWEESGMLRRYCARCGFEEWEEQPKLPTTPGKVLMDSMDYIPVAVSVLLGVLILAALSRRKRR